MATRHGLSAATTMAGDVHRVLFASMKCIQCIWLNHTKLNRFPLPINAFLDIDGELPRGVHFDHLVASDPELLTTRLRKFFSQLRNGFDSCDNRIVFGDRCHEAKSLVCQASRYGQ